MTCVAGIEQDGHVWIGADSAATDYAFDQDIRADEKVFRIGEFILGFTSSFRMGQILRYALVPPEQSKTKDDYEYLVIDFIDAVREVFKEKGFLRLTDDEDEPKQETGGTFLLGYHGKLYTVMDDFQVARTTSGLASVGSGSSFALGSLATSAILSSASPEDRLIQALEISSTYNAAVRGPFIVLSS